MGFCTSANSFAATSLAFLKEGIGPFRQPCLCHSRDRSERSMLREDLSLRSAAMPWMPKFLASFSTPYATATKGAFTPPFRNIVAAESQVFFSQGRKFDV